MKPKTVIVEIEGVTDQSVTEVKKLVKYAMTGIMTEVRTITVKVAQPPKEEGE